MPGEDSRDRKGLRATSQICKPMAAPTLPVPLADIGPSSHTQLAKAQGFWLGTVAHTCNPSTVGGRGSSSSPASASRVAQAKTGE
ncbi:hypothetical protein AAY473_019326 [Plecturocebus cupreus]